MTQQPDHSIATGQLTDTDLDRLEIKFLDDVNNVLIATSHPDIAHVLQRKDDPELGGKPNLSDWLITSASARDYQFPQTFEQLKADIEQTKFFAKAKLETLASHPSDPEHLMTDEEYERGEKIIDGLFDQVVNNAREMIATRLKNAPQLGRDGGN